MTVAKRRVVVTGLGMLTPLGNDVASTWQGLLAGQSGIGLIEHFDTSNYGTKFAGLVKNFDASAYMTKKDTKKMDLFIQYGIAAGVQAFNDSGLEVTEQNVVEPPFRIFATEYLAEISKKSSFKLFFILQYLSFGIFVRFFFINKV